MTVLAADAPGAIDRAAQTLADGDLLGLPTETVYGLAADAGSDAAVAKIFVAKGRPSDHPLIVHVAPGTGGAVPPAVAAFAAAVPAWAEALMRAFWPGPLTLILPRRVDVASAAAGGQDSIGLRCPSHPVAQAVLLAAARRGVHGVAAPSANQFGRVSPTTAAHVASEFGDDLLVLDGGPCAVGIESTIVDCTRGVPVLLRPGGIDRQQIERACGLPLRSKDELNAPDPRASGTLEAHYAPRAGVRLMTARALQTALDVLGAEPDAGTAGAPAVAPAVAPASAPAVAPAIAPAGAPTIAVYARAVLRSRSGRVVVRRMPDDAAAAAQQLFATLRDLDALGVRLIWVETPPDNPAWEGVRDRLQRAAAA